MYGNISGEIFFGYVCSVGRDIVEWKGCISALGVFGFRDYKKGVEEFRDIGRISTGDWSSLEYWMWE